MPSWETAAHPTREGELTPLDVLPVLDQLPHVFFHPPAFVPADEPGIIDFSAQAVSADAFPPQVTRSLGRLQERQRLPRYSQQHSLLAPTIEHALNARELVIEAFDSWKKQTPLIPAMLKEEEAHIQMFGPQTGGNNLWFIPREGGFVNETTMPPRLRARYADALRIMGEHARQHAAPPTPRSYPLGTNPGWPTYTAGPGPSMLAGALAAVSRHRGVEAMVDVGTRCAESLYPGRIAEPHSVIGTRSHPKPRIDVRHAEGDGRIVTIGKMTGVSYEARIVRMMSAAGNMGALDAAAIIDEYKATLYSLHRLSSEEEAARASDLLRAGLTLTIKDDSTRFDQHVSADDLSLIGELVYGDLPGLDAWRWLQTLPVVTPGLSPRSALRWRSKGMISSGEILTASDGGFHNMGLMLAGLGEMWRISQEEVWYRYRTRRFGVLAQSDDTELFIAPSDGFDAVAYTGIMAEMHQIREPVAGRRFLMMDWNRLPDGPITGYVSRAVWRSVHPEHPVMNTDRLFIGLGARLLRNVNHPWFDHSLRVISVLLHAAGIPIELTPQQLFAWLTDPDILRRLAANPSRDRELINNAIKTLSLLGDEPGAADALAILTAVDEQAMSFAHMELGLADRVIDIVRHTGTLDAIAPEEPEPSDAFVAALQQSEF